MTISLITGINGFVGKHLGKLLISKGHIVYGTSRSAFLEHNDYYNYLITTALEDKDEFKKILKKIKPDYIFHLMAQSNVRRSWEDPDGTFYTNVEKTTVLLDAVAELDLPVRIINVGSSEEYGYDPNWQMPIKEDYELNPQNPYGESKAAVSRLIANYLNVNRLDIIHMRPFNHIGPGQRLGFVVPDFANQIVKIENGLSEPKLKVGDLTSKRDFSDVRDIVNAYLLAAEKGETGSIYNVCSGVPLGIITILEKLIALSKVEISYEIDKRLFRPNDIPFYFGDNTKIISHTQWKPKWLIDDSLVDTINYFRTSFNQ
ncbi:GDP-mannose 4,6-dehydratase [Paenibacillus doosanensis]|uniref:GDP-mannose 4,6-dehydratase n=1 Tax=Paenibacillus doosanensis TaxID=1229154 RepID=UPI00218097CE|nr:GDP-mannose 4,6-dehydratase [Paenibacillus doosanensis]MCS7464254.1 GDP-mannose 4,6-dehydratase [Paenibacillus doosanensis]